MHAAIVGAGGAGLLHALALRAHGVPVALVYDPVPARAENLAHLCGARPARSLEAVIDSSAACVSLCGPPHVHFPQAVRCAREGRTVFVEKPVAVSRPELAQLARAPGCVPIVQWRAGRGLQAIRAAMSEWLLGASPSVSVDLSLRRSAEYFTGGRGTLAGWGCGALLSVGIHAIDAVCFAIDRAVHRVHGLAGPCPPGEGERSAGAVVSFAGGALATVRVTFDAAEDEVRLAFAGAGVSAVIAGGEIDPTAGPVAWKSDSRSVLRRLEAIEHSARGHHAPPLLVPYLGDAVRALREGLAVGSAPALPSIADVVPAHEIALRATHARATPPVSAAGREAPACSPHSAKRP